MRRYEVNFFGRFNLNTWGGFSQQKNDICLYFLSIEPASEYSDSGEDWFGKAPAKILVDLREAEYYIRGKC